MLASSRIGRSIRLEATFPRRVSHLSALKQLESNVFLCTGWSGKCGNNEVTCHLSGYGPKGKISFDW